MDNSLIRKIIDYWNNQPCNIKHGQSPFGTEQYFNEVTAKRYKAEPHIKEFAGFEEWQGKKVLEIGSGIGTDGEQFARHGADYTAIDISDESLKICKQRFDLLNLHGKFINGSVTDVDFLKSLGTFDLVYSFGVLHHTPGMKNHLENISNLLALGGELRFMVYAHNSWKYAMIQKGLDQFEAQADCPYAETFTKQDIIELLNPYYHDIEIKQVHCFMYNIPLYKQGIYQLEPWFESMPDTMREAINEHLGWHLLVKAHKK
jgi:2-polyprenyl-3-methyl-5-hydroxy-6-metoxy-1,4-benzoquinol methylase